MKKWVQIVSMLAGIALGARAATSGNIMPRDYVPEAPTWVVILLTVILPIIFFGGMITLLIAVSRYFAALGRNVKAIKDLLEKRESQSK